MYGINDGKTMQMIDRWINPDYDGRVKSGPMSLKSLEEGDLIEVTDRSNDPDGLLYVRPHNRVGWNDYRDVPEIGGRQARSIIALAKPVEDNYTSFQLRMHSNNPLIERLIKHGVLTLTELKRMAFELEKLEGAEDEGRGN